MNTFLILLVQTGPALLTGTTLVLVFGCLATLLCRAPIDRQRVGEFTIVATCAWLILGAVPLPRPFQAAGLNWITAANKSRQAGPPLQTRAVGAQAAALRVLPPATASETGPSGGLSAGSAPASGLAAPLDHMAAVPSQATLERQQAAGAIVGSNWEAALAFLYLVGSVASLAWLILGYALLGRIVRSAEPPDAWLGEAFEELRNAVPTRRIRLLVSRRHPRAMSFGVLKPTIVLPLSACRPENIGRLHSVLRHELAHIRQRDALGNLLFNLALPLLYFHPCFWWLRFQSRAAAELIADECASQGVSRADYARELIDFVRACGGPRPRLQPIGTTGILDSPTLFARRMEMLLRRDQPLATESSRRWRLGSAAGFTFVVAALAASLGAAPPEEPAGVKTERRLKTVEQHLKTVERERDELRKQAAALGSELKEVRLTLERLVRQSQVRPFKVENFVPRPAEPPGRIVAQLPPLVDFVERDDLEGVCDVQVSADGKWLYSAAFQAGTIAQFAVDAKGHLRHQQTWRDPHLRGTTAFRLFRDGRSAVACACFAKTAVLFKRDPATGGLTIEKTFKSGDDASIGMNWPVDVTVSPDAKFIYFADSHGPGDRQRPPTHGGEVTILQPSAQGSLQWVDSDLGQDNCFSGARGVLCDATGTQLFVTSHWANTLVICERDPKSGLIEIRQIFRQGETGTKCLQDVSMSALSPDGRFLYTAAGNFGKTGAVGAFQVQGHGTASLIQQFVNGEDGFHDFVGGNKVIVSPDGRRLYATATGSGALACFLRDPATGRLTHEKTLTQTGNGKNLAGANGLAFDPKGRFLFVGCEEGKAIAVFECHAASPGTARGAAVEIRRLP